MDSRRDTLKRVGCPIRRSQGHRALAPRLSFSQRATSFIASRCQGIHQMPLSCSPTPSPKAALAAVAGGRCQRTDVRCQMAPEPTRPVPRCIDHLVPDRCPGADASASPLPGFPPAYLHTHARARPINRTRPEGQGGLSCHARFTVTTRFTMSKRHAAHACPALCACGRRAPISPSGRLQQDDALLRPPGSQPTPGGPGPT
jgi:hypothetical protein